MQRSAFYGLAMILFSSTTVSAEVCDIDWDRDLMEFEPDCSFDAAFEASYDASFGERGFPQPSNINRKMTIYAGKDRNSIRFQYDVSFLDEEVARKVEVDDQTFNLVRLSFLHAIRTNMCRFSKLNEAVQDGTTMEFEVVLSVGEPAEENDFRFLSRRSFQVAVANCEAH